MIRTRIDTAVIRKQFPILERMVNGKPLIYFDSGATAQKPSVVIETIKLYYETQNANIHRGVHTLSQEITSLYEEARETVRRHLNAAFVTEIIFTPGTTGSINLVADCLGRKFISKGDEIVLSVMEHHSNILPWQKLAEEKGAVLKVIPVTDQGELNMGSFSNLLGPKTKIVAITHVSNTLGTINPVKEITQLAHREGAVVLIDGAQAVPHMKVDVRDLDADFYCFSAHKAYGPTGLGVLYGKEEWLNKLPNYQVGGGTIKTVSFQKTEYADLPLRFEAGTPHIAGAIGLAAALNYMNEISLEEIASHEHELMGYATEQLQKIEGLRIIGNAKQKAGVISFVMEGQHPYDIGMILDKQGIAVRTGHHCTQPLMERFNIPGTVRVTFAVFNTSEEVDVLCEGIRKAKKMLS